MKKLKLKKFVVPTLYIFLFVLTFYVTLTITNNMANNNVVEETSENINYVDDSILQRDMPVINEEEPNKMLKPFTNDNVKIGKNYYDYKADEKTQENSITYHNNTYMQNSGIDYIFEEAFDVVSVLDGTVISVKEDDLLGKVVEIKHDNNFVSTYQSLSSVDVKKDDKVTKGQVIGKSGTNELDKEEGNHLHFELYLNGGVVNPSLYIDKELKDENKKN